MADLLSRDEAWARIAALAAPLPEAEMPLSEAVGRVLARDVVSPIDIPGFDRSAMDGWALRSADAPGRLRVVGEVAAGDAPTLPVDPGTAQRIFTGGALPPGADAVERQEVVAEVRGNKIEIDHPVAPGLNVRRRGEDVPAGTRLLAAGDEVTVQALTALAAAGLPTVPVHGPARVAILLTGDELVPPGRRLGPGQIHETSGITLRALAARAGAEVIDLGMAADNRGAIGNRIQLGLRDADVLLVAGGVSVGEHDHVRPALGDAGVQELFWGVRVKPGKPLFCGRRPRGAGAGSAHAAAPLAGRAGGGGPPSDVPWAFGLPGNPLSGVVSFLVFVEPLLRRLHGERDAVERRVRARTTTPVAASDGRTTYLTATLATAADGALEATPTEQQGSAMTLALARADGFIIAPEDGPQIAAGHEVDVLPL